MTAIFSTKLMRDPVERIGRVFALTTAFLCLAPLPLMVAVATTQNWALGIGAGGFTLDWLREGWEDISPYLWFSLRLALIVLVLDLLIGLPAAWLLARRRFPGRQLVLSLTMLPVAVPGIAIALGLLLAYPTAKAGGWLLLWGQVLYTLPFLIGTLVPALSDPTLQEREQVAATLGAGLLKRLLFVTMPQTRTALLAAVIMILTLSMGEFNVSFFLFTPLNKPLPVELYSAYITNRLEVAAAITLWFLLFVIPATIAIESLGGGKVGQA